MRQQHARVLTLVMILGLAVGAAQASENGRASGSQKGSVMVSQKEDVPVGEQKILDFVRQQIRDKVKHSGTLDIYDADINAVRNLRTIKFPEKVSEKDGMSIATIEYRDINSGAIVQVEAVVAAKDETLAMEKLVIKQVVELDKGEDLAAKEYSDAEIQDFMKTYVEKQSKFTGSVMLFDEERAVMRQLKLLELSEDVRRMGIFYNSRAQFEDTVSGEVLGIDIAVENKGGVLDVQALRIRDVKKGSSPGSN